MKPTELSLPCGCIATATHDKGERGVACPRHRRSFVIGVVLPAEKIHKILREIPYRETQLSPEEQAEGL